MLYILNHSDSSTTTDVNAEDFGGVTLIDNQSVTIAPKGIVALNLCAGIPAERYGKVTVVSTEPNIITAHMIRIGDNQSYRFSTPMR
jgi:hypothetical protein